MTTTFAVARSPEQTALVPHAVRAGVIVSVLKMGAPRTVTVDVAVCPIASWTVMTTLVSAETSLASRTIVAPLTACATGKIELLLENAA